MKSLSSSPGRSANALPAAEFLRADGRMASVLPAAAKLAALQKDCARNLPQQFQTCAVLKLEEGVLSLSAPNAAAAARVKQMLPGLLEKLNQAGWRIESIRVKVQVKVKSSKALAKPKRPLPPQAISSLAELHDQIRRTGNQALSDALGILLARHTRKK